MTDTKPLFQKMGGYGALKSVVDKFYAYVQQDDRVKDYFKNTDIPKQSVKTTDYIAMAAGGPNQYKGLGLKQVHEKMGIGNKEFDAAWQCFEKSLHDHKMDAQLVKQTKNVFYSVEGDVVTKK